MLICSLFVAVWKAPELKADHLNIGKTTNENVIKSPETNFPLVAGAQMWEFKQIFNKLDLNGWCFFF